MRRTSDSNSCTGIGATRVAAHDRPGHGGRCPTTTGGVRRSRGPCAGSRLHAIQRHVTDRTKRVVGVRASGTRRPARRPRSVGAPDDHEAVTADGPPGTRTETNCSASPLSTRPTATVATDSTPAPGAMARTSVTRPRTMRVASDDDLLNSAGTMTWAAASTKPQRDEATRSATASRRSPKSIATRRPHIASAARVATRPARRGVRARRRDRAASLAHAPDRVRSETASRRDGAGREVILNQLGDDVPAGDEVHHAVRRHAHDAPADASTSRRQAVDDDHRAVRGARSGPSPCPTP